MPAAKNFKSLAFNQGDILVREGDPGNEAFLIIKGTVTVFKGTAAKKIILNQLNPGQVLGEMAVISGEARSASAQAAEPCEVLVIDEKALNVALNKSHFLAKALLTRLIKLLREKSRQVNGDLPPDVVNHKLSQMETIFEHIRNTIKTCLDKGQFNDNQKQTLGMVIEACNLTLKG